MNKELLKIIVAVSVFVAAIVLGYNIISYDVTHGELVTDSTVSDVKIQRITVDVEGEVCSPGEYSVPKGTNLHDVLHMAGGATKEADLSDFDFDTAVFENCRIFVPVSSNRGETPDEKLTQPIDINKANAQDFAQLHGIGDNLASQIINYRNLHGDFKTTEELMNVKGIGKSKYEAIRDMITVGGN